MRTVTLNIAKFGLVIGNTIKLQLINSVGGLLLSNSGYMLDSTTILDSKIFEIPLLENEHIDTLSNYKLTLPNNLNFLFKVPSSFENISHDMLSLMRIGCTKNIIDIDTKTLDSSFVEKLDIYFSGENPYFTKAQKDVVELYSYYADEILNTQSTIDIMQMMDMYLSKKGII
ncbi:MAG: hypothetical protein NTW78_03920 [Campylobacterales bacterium]|nr:hypothetical protein [Campylobacterales bacterium]